MPDADFNKIDLAAKVLALGFYTSPEMDRRFPAVYTEMGIAFANLHNADEQLFDRARTALGALGNAVDPRCREYFPVFDHISVTLHRSDSLSSSLHTADLAAYDSILIYGQADDGRRALFLASTSFVDPNTKGPIVRAYLEEKDGKGNNIRVFGIGCPVHWVSTISDFGTLLADKRSSLGEEIGLKEYKLSKPVDHRPASPSTGPVPGLK